MSNLIYKSRSHSKTIELVNEIISKAQFNKREGFKDNMIVINKSPMTNYHINYIIESLENEGFTVIVGEGRHIYHLFIM